MGMGRALALTRAHFLFTKSALYRPGRATDYGDKVQRAIGTTDPGAVPGGSTKIGGLSPVLTGPN